MIILSSHEKSLLKSSVLMGEIRFSVSVGIYGKYPVLRLHLLSKTVFLRVY